MREPLLGILRSPFSNQSFCLEVFEKGKIGTGEEQIISGRLYTVSGREEYPVINGVPRILERTLLARTLKNYTKFVDRFGGKFNNLADVSVQDVDNGSLVEATQESFGTQWNIFSDMYAEWRENFLEYISPHLTMVDFRGKSVLDCGCGFGRHLYYSSEFGARMAVGVDISHAVDAAVVNVAKFPNAHVIQASIYDLPLCPDFDLTYCIGVLQHLPDPVKALKLAADTLAENGKLYLWIYGTRPGSYHLLVDSMRKLTVGMSSRRMYQLSYFLALLSFSLLAYPRRLLTKVGFGAIGRRIPYSSYASYPFRVSHADWYDRLAAPKTAYFTEHECWEMLRATSCQNLRVTVREGGTWKLYGERRQS